MRNLVNRIAPWASGNWTELISEFLYPRSCLLCAAPGHSGLDLCQDCLLDLPRNTNPCARCGLPLAGQKPDGVLCGRCQRNALPFGATVAPFLYRPPIDHLVTRLKFNHALPEGRLLGVLLASALGGIEVPDAIVAVPLHVRRLRERGFNQAVEIARPVARSLGIPVLPGALKRIRSTPPQTGSDAAARRRNVRGAFAARNGHIPPRVALLDDVVTTGATVAEAARTLKRAGALEVTVWAIARTPPR